MQSGTICDSNGEGDVCIRIQQSGQPRLVSFAQGWATSAPLPTLTPTP